MGSIEDNPDMELNAMSLTEKCIMCGEPLQVRAEGVVPGVSEVFCAECKRYNKPVDVEIESVSDIEAHLSNIYAMMTRLHDLVSLNVEINQRIIDGYKSIKQEREVSKVPNTEELKEVLGDIQAKRSARAANRDEVPRGNNQEDRGAGEVPFRPKEPKHW